jgi:hypothetical protein
LGGRRGGILEREQGVREMVKGLAHAIGVGEGEEDVVATVVVYSGGEIETPSPVFCP